MAYKPFVQILAPGPPLEQGDHVKVYQEILVDLGLVKWKDLKRGVYGENCWEAVNRYKKRHNWKTDGTLGQRTHVALVAHATPNQGFRFAMAKAERAGGRHHRIAEAALWYREAGPYNYTQRRPFSLLSPPLVAYGLDCSGLSITCVYAAFGNDYVKYLKSGTNHNGYGNTFSMILEGHSVRRSDVRAGDMIHCNGNQHMFVAINNDYGISHGHAGMPELVDNDYLRISDIRRLL